VRPHVELIHEHDYISHPAELPRSDGVARERRLCVDEEDGSSSLSVEFLSDWGRPGGIHHADTEYFVLEGHLEVGGKALGAGGYIRASRGVAVPRMTARRGTRILHFREGGDAGFDVISQAEAVPGHDHLTVLDSEAIEWQEAPMAGPRSPLYIKLLHHDEATDFYTRLFWATAGWTEERLLYHDCFEEAYTLRGRMTYNFGELDPKTYFFRPAGIKHGHFSAAEPDGCVWLIRSDGELANTYVDETHIGEVGQAPSCGDPSEGPVVSTRPVRSRSRGPWSGAGL
jgi:hypothetical protein